MSDNSVDLLRESLKLSLFQDREEKRSLLLNNLRQVNSSSFLGILKIGGIVKELKKKHTSIDKEIIEELKMAFLEDPDYCVEFLKIEGALHSLVGLVLGNDPFLQLLAVECCCNLSLGDAKTCYQVAKASTPYFITILQGFNLQLMNATLLAVGNLAASDVKTCNLMISQGIINCIVDCVSKPQLRESLFYALMFITKTDVGSIKNQELIKVMSISLNHFKEFISARWILCHCSTVAAGLVYLSNTDIDVLTLEIYVEIGRNEVTPENVQSATCATRLLANLSTNDKVGRLLFERWHEFALASKKYCQSSYSHLKKENLWLYANLSFNRSPELQSLLERRESDIVSFVRAFSP